MGTVIYKNCRLFVDQFDLSGDMNQINLSYEAEMKDATTFRQSTKINKPGLTNLAFNHRGFVQYGTGLVDETLFARVNASSNIVMTVIPNASVAGGVIAAGDVGFFSTVQQANYNPGGTIGDLLSFGVSGSGAGGYPLVRGLNLEPAVTGRSSTSTGSVVQVGATSASQKLYGALHVLSGSGGTLDVVVQSAALVGFGSPSSRITFSQVSGVGAQFATPVSGAITDAFYRVSFTVSGGTWVFLVTVGIV